MGTRSNEGGNKVLVQDSRNALKEMRNEIAQELSLNVPNDEYWGNVSSKECGHVGGLIGGKMVRRMIQMAEQQLKNK